jgi:RHS repeat-associated protein
LTSDHLGSTRVEADSTGAVKARHDYLPFGEDIANLGGRTTVAGYGVSDPLRQRFTQKERDSESGLDYFGARYYSSDEGRFTGVDPLLASGRTHRPDSWNRYSYCYNNPLRFVDPDGADVDVKDQKALQDIRNTLPEEIRKQVVLDANGHIDKEALNKIKSTDANFLDLKAIVNSSQVMEVATASSTMVGGTVRLDFSYKSEEEVKAETIKLLTKDMGEQAAKDAASQIKGPEGLYGNTLTPDQSPSGHLRVELSDQTGPASTMPDSQMAVTTAHEMYGHGLPFMQGKPYQHDDGGPVDKHISDIQKRTLRNFPEQPNKKATPPR